MTRKSRPADDAGQNIVFWFVTHYRRRNFRRVSARLPKDARRSSMTFHRPVAELVQRKGSGPRVHVVEGVIDLDAAEDRQDGAEDLLVRAIFMVIEDLNQHRLLGEDTRHRALP
jgi:hypothetical protein